MSSEEYVPVPPFRVDLVDQYEGHSEDGYSVWKEDIPTLEEAIAIARQITEEGIKECGSFKKWRGTGDAGIVYDSKGRLVWDGIREYKAKYAEKESE